MPNSNEIVHGQRIDLESGEQDPLIIEADLTGDELEGLRERQAQRPSLCAEDLQGADVVSKGTPNASQGLRASLKSVGESVKNMTKSEEKENIDQEEPWYVKAAVPLVVGGFLMGDAGKILFEKTGTGGIHSSFMTITCSTVSLLVAIVLVPCICGWTEGWRLATDTETLKQYCLPTIFFSTAQLFNIIQNQFLEASQRKVFAQLRIPLTAGLSKLVMGHGYSNCQWICIFAITVAVFEFECLTKNEDLFAGETIVLGLIFCIVQNVFASLGSLIGEKVMKSAPKGKPKPPFVVQKFQFALWELFFGIFVAAMIISPASHFLIDVLQGDAPEYPLFKGAVPIVFKRYSFLTYAPGAVTNMDYQAKYTEVGQTEATMVHIDNKYFTDGWATTADTRQIFAQHSGKHASSMITREQHKFHGVYDQLEKIIEKRHLLHTLTERSLRATSNGVETEDAGKFNLGNLDDRLMLNDMIKWEDPKTKKTATMNPFSLDTKVVSADTLENNFLFYLGQETKAGFEVLRIQERDQPHQASQALTKIETPMSSTNADARDFVLKPDKTTGSGGASEYFKLIQDGESPQKVMNQKLPVDKEAQVFWTQMEQDLIQKASETFKDMKPEELGKLLQAELQDSFGSTGNNPKFSQFMREQYKTVVLPAIDKFVEARVAKETQDQKDSYLKLLAAGDQASASASEGFVATKIKDAVDKKKKNTKNMLLAMKSFFVPQGNLSPSVVSKQQVYTYKKAIKYNTADSSVTIVYKRDRVGNFAITEPGPLSGKTKTMDISSSKSLHLSFTASAVLDFADGETKSKKANLTLTKVQRFATPASVTYGTDSSFAEDLKKQRDSGGKKKEDKKADKALKKSFEELSEESRRNIIQSEHKKVFEGKAPTSDTEGKAAPTDGLYQQGDELDKDNKVAMFAQNYQQFNKIETLTLAKEADKQPTFTVFTFPGKYGAGVKMGGKNGCTQQMCNLRPSQWTANFDYYTWIFPRFKNFFKPTFHSVEEDGAEDFAKYTQDPFEQATYHDITRNPMSWIFVSNPWFIVAIFCNVCQNWFSTLLSKTLSSLWKNIFAAVALACVILFDKLLLTDAVAKRDTNWIRVFLAMMGVLGTVMLFNLIPKEPAPKKDEKK